MPPKPEMDPIWRHAQYIPRNQFSCNHCNKVFQGGPLRIKYHLSGRIGHNISPCTGPTCTNEVRDEAISALQKYLDEKGKKPLDAVTKKRKSELSSSDDGASSKRSNPITSSDEDEVAYSLAKLVEMGVITYKVVESPYFIDFLTAIAKYGTGFTLPSPSKLANQLIPSFKSKVDGYVTSALQLWKKTACTLVSISWVNLDENPGKSFLSIFGCSRDCTVLLNTVEVPTDNDQVASALDEAFHSVVELVGSANIVQCIAVADDSHEYGQLFLTFFINHFPHVYNSNCAAHMVKLIFEEIVQNVDLIQTTFRTIKSIVDYICSDAAILALLRKYTNCKELKQPVGLNCLSSNYEMLESILDAKEGLVQLVRSREWCAYNKGLRGIEVAEYIENSSMWELGEILRVNLRSLYQVLCFVDHDPCSGYLYGFMEIVKDTISQFCDNNPNKYQSLRDHYDLKWMQNFRYFHLDAAFFNPAYMRTKKAKSVNWDEVTERLAALHIALVRQEAFTVEVAKYKNMLSSNGSETAEFNLTCGQWWERFGQELPILRDLASRYLSQPVSISTCKSSMCAFEALPAKEQYGSPQGFTDLHFKVNAILMERVNKYKANAREKIVLAEFNKQMSHNDYRSLRQLKLRFRTIIASPIHIGQKVEGVNGHPIRVYLEDPTTCRTVNDGIPSSLSLTISVLDGHFSNEKHSTREYFDLNDLSSGYFACLLSGDLRVTLNQGEGTLGDFSFNYSSTYHQSGKFKLAVKTDTGFSGELRILEGISNAFIVEDAEAEVSHVQPTSPELIPGSAFWFGEMSHRLSGDLMGNSDRVYNASMIGDLHDVIVQKTRQAHIRWRKVKAVIICFTMLRRAAARRRKEDYLT